ncbi:MAG: glucoamylase family protein, partial [Myxococcales bacterium]
MAASFRALLGRLGAAPREVVGAFPSDRHPVDEQPLRAELFSIDQLARHAGQLASTHSLATSRLVTDQLMSRLDENEAVLVDTYHLVTAALRRSRRVSPAAAWLLDNFYLIEDQIRLTRRNLPRAYNRELPRLANGPQAGQPRAYTLALELISHVDGRVDADSLNAFIAAYQPAEPLHIGELWAIPIMLGLALIENLRRVAARVADGRRDRDLADDWAERMLQVVEKNPTDLVLVLADMARANPPLSGPFLAELTRHLQGQSPHFTFANSWLEHRLSEQGQSIERLVLAEAQAQAADQISMGNSVTSLRFLGANDWRDFVETHSLVEKTLREDPAQVYALMDFASRDNYRHRIEEIAKRSAVSERDIARQAVALAEAAAGGVASASGANSPTSANSSTSPNGPTSTTAATSPGRAARQAHVGYYLIDRGRPALERAVKMRPSWAALIARCSRRLPLFLFLLGVLAITAGAAAVFIDATLTWFRSGPLFWSALVVPAVLCATHLGVGAINWLATLFVTARRLPRLDLSDGIPADCRTMVVVPTMLSSADGIKELLDGLEVRYLANRDDNLHFALLTDFTDAATETVAGDDDLVSLARDGVTELNRKYQTHRDGIFFLFHRPRCWNPRQGVWMGQERKRGKLAALNSFLRRGTSPEFSAVVGDPTVLTAVRYVITLDTDTQLPRDAAHEMIGAMAHSLNRPVLDAGGRCVIDGYGILQPRISVSLPTAQRSWFVRLFAGDPGVDPYTRVVSDVYQDVFSEGSFIGKGIYDVDTFERTCSGFPTNAILSHDLLEGAHARSGLLSDVELYEEYPSRYLVDVSRRHRWIRGDWQILSWLLPRVPTLGGGYARNPINAVSWWKILDNLRRSLVPIAMLALLLAGWLLLPRAGIVAVTVFVVAVLGLVPLLSVLVSLLHKPADLPLSTHAGVTGRAFGTQVARLLFTLVFIPFEAYVSFDAILRTTGRMLLTRRRLLEWTTARDAQRSSRLRLWHFLTAMAAASAVSLETASAVLLYRPDALAPAAPLLLAWFASPIIAWWLSRDLALAPVRLTRRQRRFLHSLSRKTWRFFEVFVSKDENWLPPDNVQQQGTTAVASRTSPTNIGMALLANLAAVDFGYSSVDRLMDRTGKTLETLARLDRYRGHFFNWYDTRSLKPLNPRYVSTVDSGNLAGHLLVLRSGLRELADAAVLPARAFDGIRDTAQVLADALTNALSDMGAAAHRPAEPLQRQLHDFDALFRNRPSRLTPCAALLARLTTAAEAIATAVRALPGEHPEVTWWAQALVAGCREHHQDLLHLAPWAELMPLTAELRRRSDADPNSRRMVADLQTLLARVEGGPSVRDIAAAYTTFVPTLDEILQGLRAQITTGGVTREGAWGPDDWAAELAAWCEKLRSTLVVAAARADARVQALSHLAVACDDPAEADYSFLFDRSRALFAIGYNVDERRLDGSFYDLLASEARLASFVAVAQGKVGQEHWFVLGRMLTRTGGEPALLSWSGSMFEYLMPLLVMPSYENTLLDRTYKAVVRRQIDYGNQRGVPWGISESGYNTVDLQMNYQYRAFGVPGLGLKRGLAEDLVIAPYASALALMVEPEAACRNLERLSDEGFEGAYGLFEAIDYTPSRVPRGSSYAVVRQFMSHHQGMSLLSLDYLLLDRPMQRRFQADLMLRADELLLQERIPKAVAPLFPHVGEASATGATSNEDEGSMRVFTDPAGASPEVNLLSNGQYHVMVTHAGGGYSRWRDFQVTRWREDTTRDCWGSFCYLRDVDSGAVWSTAWQPTLTETSRYQAIFTQARAEFRRRDERIDTHTEISVSPEDDVELRRIVLTNRSESPRTIEVTTYNDVVLCPQGQDMAHPAFSNLFVQTEVVRPR